MECVRARLRFPRIDATAIDGELVVRSDRLAFRSRARGASIRELVVPLRALQSLTRDGAVLRVDSGGEGGADLAEIEIVDYGETEAARVQALIESARSAELDLAVVLDEVLRAEGYAAGFGSDNWGIIAHAGERLLRHCLFALARAVGDNEGLAEDEIDLAPLHDAFGDLTDAIVQSYQDSASVGELMTAAHAIVDVDAFDRWIGGALKMMVAGAALGGPVSERDDRASEQIAARVAAAPGRDWGKYAEHYDGSVFLRSIADEAQELAEQLERDRAGT